MGIEKKLLKELDKINSVYKSTMGLNNNSVCIKCEYWFDETDVDKKLRLCFNCLEEIKDKFSEEL